MRSFKDKTGADWDVEITLGMRETIRSRLKFDFVSEAAKDINDLLEAVVLDLGRFLDMLSIVLDKQLRERSMTLQDLCDRLDGTALDSAQAAVVEGFCDFFHQARRCHRATALREVMQTMAKAVEASTATIEKAAETQRALIGSSTN